MGFHRQLTILFNNTVALIQDASPTNCGTDPLWVSLANLPRATEAEIRAWCDGWRFREGNASRDKVSEAMVEEARWIPFTLPNGVAIEVPWTMTAMQEDRTYFIDRAAPALLTLQQFTGPQEAPTLTSSGTSCATAERTRGGIRQSDGGFALTGVGARTRARAGRLCSPGGTRKP